MFNTVKCVKPNKWSVENLKFNKISKYIHDAKKLVRVRADEYHIIVGLSKFVFPVFPRWLWKNAFQNFSCKAKV